jgi:formylglycine-generating enzyme required for sulfatase activity
MRTKVRFVETFLGVLALLVIAGYARTEETPTDQTAEVTIKGNVLCNRATIPVSWDQTSQDANHVPVIYAFAGTLEITAQVNEIMDKVYPAKGLDVESAQKFLHEFTAHLEYFVAPGPLTAKLHREVEYGSQILALTGTTYEKDGRKWINVTHYEPTTLTYPAKMLAPDKPFVMPNKKPLLLKIKGNLTLKCVPIPAGRFLQGSPFYQQRYQDEFPHEVVLTKPYYMAEIPVTQEMFEAVMGENPSPVQGPQCPVEGATFTDVMEFCRILSAQNGKKVRLPTDAEWEYAARVGTSNPCFTAKYKDQISEAGVKGNATPVKSQKPNAWGLYDMLCGGWHLTSNYKADNARVREVDPQGPPRGDRSIQTGSAGPMHKSRGGFHYSFIRPNMHGAVSEDGGLWEGGTQIFRLVVETD